MTDARFHIDADLVRRLVAEQFPQWAGLEVRPVEPQGWDNRTFRLGEQLTARLPCAAAYSVQVEKERLWTPRLAAGLRVTITTPVATGEPGFGYPSPWSINRWLDGETVAAARNLDLVLLAEDIAQFLQDLHGVEAAGGPPAGPHCFWRGGPLLTYDTQTRQTLAALDKVIDTPAARAAWEAGLAAPWSGREAWFHGDFAAGNLLVRDGRLSGVIDWGCCGVGDPACDLAVAWTLLDSESRRVFRARLAPDAGTWARGRAWALWKALIVMAAAPGANPAGVERCPRIIAEIVADHRGDR